LRRACLPVGLLVVCRAELIYEHLIVERHFQAIRPKFVLTEFTYDDIPLADSKIDLSRERPNGDCVAVKTVQFLALAPPYPSIRTAGTAVP